MNFDLYEFLKYHNGSKFYPVKVEEIDELEKKLNLIVPKELKDLPSSYSSYISISG